MLQHPSCRYNVKNVHANSLVPNHKYNMMINQGIEHILIGKGKTQMPRQG